MSCSSRCRRPGFFRSASLFEKLSQLAAARSNCCAGKPRSVRLRLNKLEDRLAPAIGISNPFALLETQSVSSTGSTVTFNTTLTEGSTYIVVVNGDIVTDGSGTRADAEYRNFTAPVDDTGTPTPTINFGVRLEGVTVTPTSKDANWWGDYSPSHCYQMQVTGQKATALKAYYYDDSYTSNSGSLNVELY